MTDQIQTTIEREAKIKAAQIYDEYWSDVDAGPFQPASDLPDIRPLIEKALLEFAQPPEPKVSVQTAIELRDRATQVALNFAGQRISSSDGSYELLIECVQGAMNDAIGLAFAAVESSALRGNPDHKCQCSECDPQL